MLRDSSGKEWEFKISPNNGYPYAVRSDGVRVHFSKSGLDNLGVKVLLYDQDTGKVDDLRDVMPFEVFEHLMRLLNGTRRFHPVYADQIRSVYRRIVDGYGKYENSLDNEFE